MKRKLIIGLSVFLLLVGVVIGNDLFTKPTPKYTIEDTYSTDGLLCFKVEGYPATEPCFNETEFISIDDAQSLNTFHQRMADIEEALQTNEDRETLHDKSCLTNLECKTALVTDEYTCSKNVCIPIEETQDDWTKNINAVGETI